MNKDTKSRSKVKPKISPLYKHKRFILITLFIVFYLNRKVLPEERRDFIHRHKVLNRLYEKILKEIGLLLDLPLKRCRLCGVLFIPDYRTYLHQRHCPYGCIPRNRKENVKRAKKRYRADFKVRAKRAEYNRQYRIHGRLSADKDERSAVQSSACLRRQLLCIVRRLNPGMSQTAVAHFERRLKRIELVIKIEGDTILQVLQRWNYLISR